MIASNYIKHPEALRFQCEMFSNGYHNSPRIMRLIEVVFSWTTTTPQWVKDAKKRADDLVKHWKTKQVTCNFSEAVQKAKQKAGFYYGPCGETWSGRGQKPKWLQSQIDMGNCKEAFENIWH